jgi:hypothetical protein
MTTPLTALAAGMSGAPAATDPLPQGLHQGRVLPGLFAVLSWDWQANKEPWDALVHLRLEGAVKLSGLRLGVSRGEGALRVTHQEWRPGYRLELLAST